MNSTKACLYSSCRRQRGAAMVESVAMLPVFIILFVGIFYLRDSLVAAQEVGTKARSCAWRYSRNACRKVPTGCEGLVNVGSSSSTGDAVDEVSESVNGIRSAAGSSGGDGQRFVEKMVTKLIEPAITDLFSKTAVSSPKDEIERPAMFGGGTVPIKGHYQLACDLEEAKPIDIAKDAWALARGK